ncbi:MAG TPA: phosphoenolpyruvate--protein phosphotransferase [Desulfobacteraceae bacterium]|nr:phosphoenolpyruvate--protein phosphotransferase [Desulfobacteraceae bacterium]
MKTDDHLKLLCDAGEMFALLAGLSDTKMILKRCVGLVAEHLKAEVCSIYLLDHQGKTLVLQATKGLNPDSVGVVKMAIGQGLVGKAMADREMVLEDRASENPDFKYFPAALEEAFECFLAIPILRGQQNIGVMVVQRRARQNFSRNEAMVLRSIASQLAVLIENAKVLLSLEEKESTSAGGGTSLFLPERSMEQPGKPGVFPARPVSRGIALGRALLPKKNPLLEQLRSGQPMVHDKRLGIDALEAAIEKTVEEIETLEQQVSKRLPEAEALIFDAHIMILKDKGFSVKMKEMTRQGSSALSAVLTVARKYMKLFGSSPSEYLREKVADVEDISIRILENLLRSGREENGDHQERILIARDLLPSEAVLFAMKGVAGIVLIGGGTASHAAILARSLELPMVTADDTSLLHLVPETLLVVDAEVGNVYCNPDPDVEAQFRERMAARIAPHKVPDEETLTADGTAVDLMVNINLLSELDGACRLNAKGVGLYRSEFPFLVRNNFPTEVEQAKVYTTLFSGMADKEVTVRTLDVGGDKMLGYFDNAGEANPELGLRSIRFALHYPEIMIQQIRAILAAAWDAGAQSRMRIMFPMVSSLDEFRLARKMVVECYEALNREFNENAAKRGEDVPEPPPMPPMGMMIEMPAVVEIMEEFTREADFFSIGTNDFVQYMLAADRSNDRVAHYYTPHHPGVLRALHRIVKTVTAAGKDISVCGEMAREPAFIPFFLGIGIRKLSVNQHFLYPVQSCINQWRLVDAEQYARSLLAESSVNGTLELIRPNR